MYASSLQISTRCNGIVSSEDSKLAYMYVFTFSIPTTFHICAYIEVKNRFCCCQCCLSIFRKKTDRICYHASLTPCSVYLNPTTFLSPSPLADSLWNADTHSICIPNPDSLTFLNRRVHMPIRHSIGTTTSGRVNRDRLQKQNINSLRLTWGFANLFIIFRSFPLRPHRYYSHWRFLVIQVNCIDIGWYWRQANHGWLRS